MQPILLQEQNKFVVSKPKTGERSTQKTQSDNNTNDKVIDDMLSMFAENTALQSDESDELDDTASSSTLSGPTGYDDTKQKILKKLQKKLNKKLSNNKIESMSAAAMIRWRQKCASFSDEVVRHTLLAQPRAQKHAHDSDGLLWQTLLTQMPHNEWTIEMLYGFIIGLYDLKISTLSSHSDDKQILKLKNKLQIQQLRVMVKVTEDLLIVSPQSVAQFIAQYIDNANHPLIGLHDYYVRHRDKLLARMYSRTELGMNPLLRLPLYHIIKIKAICPWELYGHCTSNQCIDNRRVLHTVCLLCGKTHATSECPLNKARRGRRASRGRGRNRGRGRGYFNRSNSTQTRNPANLF